MRRSLPVVLVLFACSEINEAPGGAAGGGARDASAPADAMRGAGGGGSPGGAGGGGRGGAGGGPDLPPPDAAAGGAGGGGGAAGTGGAAGAGGAPAEVARFVVMGDTGTGDQNQRDVAIQVRDLCAREGCDFVLLAGDNIYDAGVESVEDPQWQEKFEVPYMDIDLPFYVALGNHDYGGTLGPIPTAGIGNEFGKGRVEVEYTMRSRKWHMPATHYTLRFGPVGLIVLDTNSILWGNNDNGDQRAWYPTALMEVQGAPWKIALGHHTYRSNGRHGNAGTYEAIEIGGVPIPIPVPILNGAGVKSFFDEVVCGTVQVYFAGHDHNRQWLDENDKLCGAELIVTGAGGKLTGFAGTTNRTHYQDDATEGFLYVVADADRLHGRFFDKTGAMNYERTVMRRP